LGGSGQQVDQVSADRDHAFDRQEGPLGQVILDLDFELEVP
jgi:hypothetical protein